MDFIRFKQEVPKIKNLPLPGRDSQYKMAPLERIDILEKPLKNNVKPKMAAVMALFYPDASNETCLLFILRNTYPGVHSNQIGFPGGKREKGDVSLEYTSLREASEEVGVEIGRVSVIRAMSDLYIPPSNFMVRPYIGIYDKKKPFILQESEVDALVEVPFRDVMNERLITTRKMNTSYAEQISVPAFELGGYVVWGATAMMLSEIKELFKRVI
jgi:8-oxo-dGTP pyrophosphatase MutT (NUDIX family)